MFVILLPIYFASEYCMQYRLEQLCQKISRIIQKYTEFIVEINVNFFENILDYFKNSYSVSEDISMSGGHSLSLSFSLNVFTLLHICLWFPRRQSLDWHFREQQKATWHPLHLLRPSGSELSDTQQNEQHRSPAASTTRSWSVRTCSSDNCNS